MDSGALHEPPAVAVPTGTSGSADPRSQPLVPDWRHSSGARRRPTQARSQLKMKKVLRAAERILDEEGEDAVTTTAVAARAGISVGWIYNYFDDRGALLEELLIDQMQELEDELEAVFYGLDHRDWRRSATAACDVVGRFYRDLPGFSSIQNDGEWTRTIQRLGNQMDEAIAEMVLDSFTLPPLREDAPDVPMRLVVATYLTLLNTTVGMVVRAQPDEVEPVLEEAARMCVAYLALYFA
ncbi:TetR/AcrR family transcriptional regulator [Nocardioides sp. GY 10127]|uniref:TetR/AcrR family transcriptional regulator n=1 Tax=Nocardioides sp. GY 10127 TaxID=2569762 RepID=UPI0010A76A10|nr:TetR/AcrR family transcriptional regulator [Nocardioides sp. GY 10127]TIC79120.1 TetR/AcrR family transcriptional regulator [Nocardioides sp. GY 10127]